jgi:hypothetical protein
MAIASAAPLPLKDGGYIFSMLDQVDASDFCVRVFLYFVVSNFNYFHDFSFILLA